MLRIELNGGSVVFPSDAMPAGTGQASVPLLWRACGAKPVAWLLLPDRGFKAADSDRVRKLFPEARVAPLSQGGRAP